MNRTLRDTVHTFMPNRLAVGNREWLFRALEEFVNLGNDVDDYKVFGAQWPTFFPLGIGVLEEEVNFGEEPGDWLIRYRWVPEALELVLAYRWLLRRVWRSDSHARPYVGVLMGTQSDFLKRVEEGEVGNGETHDHFSAGWRTLKAAFPNAEQQGIGSVSPSWPSGIFLYTPQNDFQKAFFLLFRETWRARLCQECERYFVAQKPAQIYCSPQCTGAAKRRRNLEWWRRDGAQQRRGKSSKTEATRATKPDRTKGPGKK